MPQTGTPPTQGADGLASGVNLNGDTKNGTGIASSAQESTKRLSQNSPRPYASLERYGNTSNKNDFQLSSVDNNYATFPREGSERSEFSAGGNVISYQRHGEPAGVNGDNSGFFGGSKVSMVDYNAPMYTSMQSSDRPSGPPGSVQPTSMNVQTGPVKTSEARVGVSAVSENIKTSDISSPEFACVRRKSATQPNILTPSKDLVNSTESNFAKPNTVPVLNTTPSLNHVPAMNETAQKQFNVKSGATVLNKSDRGPTQNGTEINRTPNTPAQSSIVRKPSVDMLPKTAKKTKSTAPVSKNQPNAKANTQRASAPTPKAPAPAAKAPAPAATKSTGSKKVTNPYALGPNPDESWQPSAFKRKPTVYELMDRHFTSRHHDYAHPGKTHKLMEAIIHHLHDTKIDLSVHIMPEEVIQPHDCVMRKDSRGRRRKLCTTTPTRTQSKHRSLPKDGHSAHQGGHRVPPLPLDLVTLYCMVSIKGGAEAVNGVEDDKGWAEILDVMIDRDEFDPDRHPDATLGASVEAPLLLPAGGRRLRSYYVHYLFGFEKRYGIAAFEADNVRGHMSVMYPPAPVPLPVMLPSNAYMYPPSQSAGKMKLAIRLSQSSIPTHQRKVAMDTVTSSIEHSRKGQAHSTPIERIFAPPHGFAQAQLSAAQAQAQAQAQIQAQAQVQKKPDGSLFTQPHPQPNGPTNAHVRPYPHGPNGSIPPQATTLPQGPLTQTQQPYPNPPLVQAMPQRYPEVSAPVGAPSQPHARDGIAAPRQEADSTLHVQRNHTAEKPSRADSPSKRTLMVGHSVDVGAFRRRLYASSVYQNYNTYLTSEKDDARTHNSLPPGRTPQLKRHPGPIRRPEPPKRIRFYQLQAPVPVIPVLKTNTRALRAKAKTEHLPQEVIDAQHKRPLITLGRLVMALQTRSLWETWNALNTLLVFTRDLQLQVVPVHECDDLLVSLDGLLREAVEKVVAMPTEQTKTLRKTMAGSVSGLKRSSTQTAGQTPDSKSKAHSTASSQGQMSRKQKSNHPDTLLLEARTMSKQNSLNGPYTRPPPIAPTSMNSETKPRTQTDGHTSTVADSNSPTKSALQTPTTPATRAQASPTTHPNTHTAPAKAHPSVHTPPVAAARECNRPNRHRQYAPDCTEQCCLSTSSEAPFPCQRDFPRVRDNVHMVLNELDDEHAQWVELINTVVTILANVSSFKNIAPRFAYRLTLVSSLVKVLTDRQHIAEDVQFSALVVLSNISDNLCLPDLQKAGCPPSRLLEAIMHFADLQTLAPNYSRSLWIHVCLETLTRITFREVNRCAFQDWDGKDDPNDGVHIPKLCRWALTLTLEDDVVLHRRNVVTTEKRLMALMLIANLALMPRLAKYVATVNGMVPVLVETFTRFGEVPALRNRAGIALRQLAEDPANIMLMSAYEDSFLKVAMQIPMNGDVNADADLRGCASDLLKVLTW